MSTKPLIHPTAIIDPAAQIAPDVQIGPYTVIEGPVTIGPGTVIASQVKLVGPMTIGARNQIHSFAVLGGWPQDRKFDNTFSQTIIGDDNIIREAVTIHRGTGKDTVTKVGSRCFLMVNAHIGHNSIVADDVTMINGSMIAGHVHVDERAIIGGNCAIHQFCRVGRLSMVSSASAHNVDIPPYCILMSTNTITQLNAVGLRRSGMPMESINGIRKMFKLLFRTHQSLKKGISELPPELLAIPEVKSFIDFCQHSKRGIARYQSWSSRHSSSNSSEE